MNGIVPLAIAASIFSGQVLAENIIRAQAPVAFKAAIHEKWVAIDPVFSEWVNAGSVTGCTNWSPLPPFIEEGTSFIQTATDCQQDQTRSRQEREQETNSLVIRNNGEPTTETRTVSTTSTRNAIGTDASAPLSRYFTFIEKSGPATGQYGCNYESVCMSNPAESSMNGKSATYMTLGYANAVNFGLAGYSGNQLKAVLTKLRIEMFDANGVKYYTLTQTAPFSNQYGSYVGNTHTAEDYSKSTKAYKMRVSFELAE